MEVVASPLRARPASPLLKRRAGEYASRPRAIRGCQIAPASRFLMDLRVGIDTFAVAPPPAHPDGEALRPRSIRQLRGAFLCGISGADSDPDYLCCPDYSLYCRRGVDR